MRTTLKVTDHIAWITMDDGKVNAMSQAMLEELIEQIADASQKARVTVLTGREGIFSAGFDMPTFTRDRTAVLGMVNAGIQLILRMLEHPHPIVTACTGHAFPMGAFLLLSSDVRIGTTGAYRIGMNEVAIGITVPKFALALARSRLTAPGSVGVLTGRTYDPESAVRVGYLDELQSSSSLKPAALQSAKGLLDIDLDAYRATKRRINESLVSEIIHASTEFED